MTRKWYQVAKAGFLASTARFHGKRRIVLTGLFALGAIWALYIVPTIMTQILDAFGPLLDVILQSPLVLPGFMRSVVMLVWFMLFIFPMSTALQEIKIGQWEIMLSNDVKTRSIMIGTFLAKIPMYGLVTLILAPLLVVPFAIVYEVSFVGQVCMYLVVLFVALSTLWLSNLVTTAIQSKLGDSPRGNDLAKALAVVLGIVLIVPMYSLIYFAPTLSQILGTDAFLLLPFTWGADLLTWVTVSFNGVGLSQAVLTGFASALTLNWLSDLLLLSAFTLVLIGLAFGSAGRLFRIGAGARVEKIVTARRNGPFLRLIRRAAPGSFGVLLTSSIKDFTRKAQNVSMMVYAMILSIMVPFFISISGIYKGGATTASGFITLFFVPMYMGWMLAIFSSMVFGGVAFLDSQDQLWTIKTPPNGTTKFIKARLVQSLLMGLPIATIPTIVLTFVMNYTLAEGIAIWIYGYASICGASMVAIGISAINPTYDDTQSGAFKTNRMVTIFIVIGATILWFIIMVTRIFADVKSLSTLDPSILPYVFVIMIAPLLLVGLLTLFVGAKRLARPY